MVQSDFLNSVRHDVFGCFKVSTHCGIVGRVLDSLWRLHFRFFSVRDFQRVVSSS